MYPQRSVMTCGLATALEPPHFNHAPVRGATPAPDLRIRGRVVSIHAPAWGATREQPLTMTKTNGFQSTHPRGVRHGRIHTIRAASDVSIHAPAWGATWASRYQALSASVFQSTHPRGVRPTLTIEGTRRLLVSIHAPAWGATATRICRTPGRSGFNPRTRVGCD